MPDSLSTHDRLSLLALGSRILEASICRQREVAKSIDCIYIYIHIYNIYKRVKRIFRVYNVTECTYGNILFTKYLYVKQNQVPEIEAIKFLKLSPSHDIWVRVYLLLEKVK